jgi:Flp pilus assembly protein TadG
MTILRDRRGNSAVVVALLMVPLLLFLGLAVDFARAWVLKSRLTTAIDAAALEGARDIDVSTRNANMTNLFWGNFNRSGANSTTGFMNSTVTGPTITQPDAHTIAVTAQASIPTTFLSLLGTRVLTVQASNSAVRATSGTELALVLDNTGSMAGWPIGAVITAAQQLLNIVYGHASSDTGSGTPDTQPNLWVSIVPFAAMVNIGNTHTGWLAAGSLNQTSYAKSSWLGCVMARVSGGNDFTDATPTQAPFTPYLWASTLGKYKVGKTVVTGDNDWSPTTITEQNQDTLTNTAVGPNLGCPRLPILGLQPSRNAAMAVVNQMVATYRGGTFINLGLQAGWWTLSPNWRGWWGSSTLPLNYNTPNMQKVIVLMTDGNNDWYDWPDGAPGAGPSPWVNDGDTDYSAYGRLKQNLMGLGNVTQANATTTINSLMSQMCTIIKSNGVVIYTILFNHSTVSTDTQTLFQNCATSPQNYFLTPTAADLEAAFSQIGNQLASVRLTQ